MDLPGLDQSQRLEEFIECTVPSGKEHERRRVLNEHRLPDKEVPEFYPAIDVAVMGLLFG